MYYLDLSIGFQKTSYSVSESDGLLEIIIGAIGDENIPEITIPLGVRITSRDETATGKRINRDM